MKLTSKPKPVIFRIVLKNNTEITSIELLQRHFDFERFFVTDQTQFISWLKRKDKKRGDQIEKNFNQSAGEISLATALQTLNIIYDPKSTFKDMVDFVNFLYDNNENNCYETVKSNLSDYISNQGKLLYKLFPIDSIREVDNNLEDFYDSLNATVEVRNYLSQLYYRHGDIRKSRKAYPPLWKLEDRERKAIQAITSCRQLNTLKDVITSDNLSIIGAEFIFLCAIANLSIYKKGDHCTALSELIDEGPAFKPMRDRIGGSLKKRFNKKNPDFYKVCTQLGYTSPDAQDPLFNEKLFLSSFFAEAIKRDTMRAKIRQNEYFPALFIHNRDRFESTVFQSAEELQYSWLRLILDYHDHPTGLDGDEDRENKDIREMAIIVHQFKEEDRLMSEYFHFPSDLSADLGNSNQRERISHIKSAIGKAGLKNVEKYGTVVSRDEGLQRVFGSWAKNPPALRKTEREYLDFFKEVVNICNHWEEYITFSRGNKGSFTTKAESLVKKYKKKTKNKTLWNEKLFVVTILLLVRDHNRNSINEEETEIKQLKKTYIPLRALFYDEIDRLNKNDKKILKSTFRDERLRNNWLVYNCPEMRDNNVYRENFYSRILRRWISNFVYYTE